MSEASSTSVLLSVNNQENQLDNTDNDVEDIEEIQTKRETNTVYDEYATYAHIAEFVESLEQGQIDGNKWSKKEKRVTKLGEKQFYKCSSCSKKLFSLKLRTSLEVQVCIEDCLHQHSKANSKEAWEKSKNRVLEMYQKEGKKPKAISRWLRLHLKSVKIVSENWESSTCSCHYWQKNFKCKHTIGTSHFLNLNKFPGLDLAIEGNAKRGRKKKARSALERNSIAPINRQLDNLNQHEVQQEASSTVLSVNYSIVNVSHQNQLVLASNSAVQDLVESNIQISEKSKRGRPKKSNNESEQPSKRLRN